MNEIIRYSTSVFSIVTAIAVVSALRAQSNRLVTGWLVVATLAGIVLTHVIGALPVPQLLPAGAVLGFAIGMTSMFSADAGARFAQLEDRQWRLLMLLRGVFGALLLAGGAAGLMPNSFALPAGAGDLATAALALVAPGSLAFGGHRGARLLVFGVGFIDFVSVIFRIVTVLVPWLAETHALGLSMLLPWVAVPLLFTLNLHGLRAVVRELVRSPVPIA